MRRSASCVRSAREDEQQHATGERSVARRSLPCRRASRKRAPRAADARRAELRRIRTFPIVQVRLRRDQRRGRDRQREKRQRQEHAAWPRSLSGRVRRSQLRVHFMNDSTMRAADATTQAATEAGGERERRQERIGVVMQLRGTHGHQSERDGQPHDHCTASNRRSRTRTARAARCRPTRARPCPCAELAVRSRRSSSSTGWMCAGSRSAVNRL